MLENKESNMTEGMRFVSRIKGVRDPHELTATEFDNIVRFQKCSPAFTLQEYFQGAHIVSAYYDWDAKYDNEPSPTAKAEAFEDFKEVLETIHPGHLSAALFARRHGFIAKGKFKISFRAWFPTITSRVKDIPFHVRAALKLGPKECHASLDLSVYKEKEQLLGCIGGCKDIDGVKRFLVPIDSDGEDINWDDIIPADYLAQNVRKDAVTLTLGTHKTKKARHTDTMETMDPEERETFTVEDSEAKEALMSATETFGDRYRMQEELTLVTVNRKDKFLIFPTKQKWCYIKKRTHIKNNPYIAMSEHGARFKCPDEECKAAGDLPHIPLSQLPQPLREFFTKMCYKHVDEHLMSEAKDECKRNIITNFPEEEAADTSAFNDVMTTIARHQICRSCKSLQMQFEHTLRGWNLRCNDCGHPWPSHPISLPEQDFPKLYAALTQLNVNIGSVTVHNNYLVASDEPFVGAYDSDGLVVFEDEHRNNVFLNSLQGTDATLSEFVFESFKDDFHCTKSGAKGTEGMWYQFRQHRWVPKAELTLRKKLGSEDSFLKYYKCASGFYERECIQTDDTKRKSRHIKRVCEQLGDGARRRRILEDAIELFHEHRPDFSDELDMANMLVFQNGVLDLNSFKFRNGRPDDVLSIQLKFMYEPLDYQAHDCRFVMDFMNAIQPDEQARDYLLTVLSLCLTTDTSMQYFWIFTGAGANGKSKLMNLLNETLSEHYGTAPAALLTRRREDANQANESLSALEKSRVAVFSEGASSEILQVNTIKLFTGEDIISTRGLREKQRRWKPNFKCILVCNDIPQLDDNSWAAWRRIKVVNFPTKFVDNPKRPHERKKDSELGNRLSRCLAAFVAILIEYYRRFKEGGLIEPSEVTRATERYQTDNDIFEEFRLEHIIDTPVEEMARLQRTELTKAFRRWANERKKILPEDKKLWATFNEKLGEMFNNQWDKVKLRGWKHKRLVGLSA